MEFKFTDDNFNQEALESKNLVIVDFLCRLVWTM